MELFIRLPRSSIMILALLLIQLVLTPTFGMVNNNAAAICCGLGPRCNYATARRAGPCRPKLFMSQQPGRCRHLACQYCYYGNRKFTQICRRLAIVKQCFGGRVQHGKNRRPASKPRPHGKCAWRARKGKVVIPTTSLKTHYPWVKQYGGITWKPNGGNGVDGMGSGAFCARVIVDKPGPYYLTVLSSAPHPTEHNDLWIRFSAGLRWFKPQGYKWLNKGSGWFKGYENEGRKKVANYLLTKDFDGHQFVTYPLRKGQVYSVCLSGRSSKYTIYKIVMVKCNGWYCSRFGGYMRWQMSRLGSSKCY